MSDTKMTVENAIAELTEYREHLMDVPSDSIIDTGCMMAKAIELFMKLGQANGVDKSAEPALSIRDVVGRSEQLRACKKLHKCRNPGVQCRDGKYYACYE